MSEFQNLQAAGLAESLAQVGQEVQWNGKSYRAIGDGFAFGTVLEPDGGGFAPQFSGEIVFAKFDFPDGVIPKEGDLVHAGPHKIRLLSVSGSSDPSDASLTYTYGPADR